MTMGPRLTPFPVADFFYRTDVVSENDIVAAHNRAANDGVQLNLTLGGYAPSWEHPQAINETGLLRPNSMYDPTGTYNVNNRVPNMPYGEYYDTVNGLEWYIGYQELEYTGIPDFRSIPETCDPTFRSRYISDAQRYWPQDPVLVAGTRAYPGVFGLRALDTTSPVWHNAPISYEAWFSENPNRSDPQLGYSGYTFYGGQGNPAPSSSDLRGIPGIRIRNQFVGIMRTSADITNVQVADMMCGVIIKQTGPAETTITMCGNGVAVWTYVIPQLLHASDVQIYWNGAFGGLVADVENNIGTINDFEVYSDYQSPVAFQHFLTSSPSPGPDYSYIGLYDTYDTKYGMYFDFVSDSLPLNQPYDMGGGSMAALTWDTLSLYTHPAYPIPVAGYADTPSSITSSPADLRADVRRDAAYEVRVGKLETQSLTITEVGEIIPAQAPTPPQEFLVSGGENAPIKWSTLMARIEAATVRASNITIITVPQLVPVTTWQTTVNSGTQYTIGTAVTGGNPPYSYAYTATGITVTIPPTANPTFTLPTLAPGSANQTFTLTATYTDTPIVPGYAGSTVVHTSPSITLVAPAAPAGTISTATIPILGAAALTLTHSGSVDDSFVAIVLPFPVKYLGSWYSTIYIGSNSYATFTAGSSAYSGLSASNPPYPGIHISAADNSYQRVYSGSENGGATFRIRYEGNNGTSGTVGASTMIWELTFTQATPDIIKLSIGNNSRSGNSGTSGCTSGTSYVLAIPFINANTGYNITSA